MIDAVQRFSLIADGDERYVDRIHAKALNLKPGTTVKAIGEGIASIFHEEIPVDFQQLPQVAISDPAKTSGKIPKTTFLALKPERRQPLEIFKTPLEDRADTIIAGIQFELSDDRAATIRHAIFAALNEHPNAHLPKNPFRESDTEETAFYLAVAADQQGSAYILAHPPKFKSVTGMDSQGSDFPDYVTTANEDYCTAIKKAIHALMFGEKIQPSTPEPVQLDLDLQPGKPFVPPEPPAPPVPSSTSSTLHTPPPAPRAPARRRSAVADDELDSPEWWNFDKNPL